MKIENLKYILEATKDRISGGSPPLTEAEAEVVKYHIQKAIDVLERAQDEIDNPPPRIFKD